MLAAVLGDRRNLRRSVGPVVAGGLSAIAIGWLLGDIVVGPVTAQTNAQVTARVKLRLVDLLAAPATGAVGSIALVRRDISDTLPGVASTISLVPPLTVVGLTLQTRQFSRADGVPLLFVNGVAAIPGVGTNATALSGVHSLTPQLGTAESRALNRRNAVLVIAALALIVAVSLTSTSVTIARLTYSKAAVTSGSQTWSGNTGWELVSSDAGQGKIIARFEGPPPYPDTDTLEST